MLSERGLAGVAPQDVAESFGGGVEVVAGGVQGSVTEEGLQLDDVGADLERRGGEGCGAGRGPTPLWAPAPGGRRGGRAVR
jgi:hypothetical protein